MPNNLFAYIASISTVVIANAGYHFLAKVTPVKLNVFFGLCVTYLVAMIGSLILFMLTKNTSVKEELSHVSYASILLGFVLLSVETGWIWMYRSGWSVSSASITQSMFLAVILAVLGTFVFREEMNAVRLAGIVLCLFGVFLLNR